MDNSKLKQKLADAFQEYISHYSSEPNSDDLVTIMVYTKEPIRYESTDTNGDPCVIDNGTREIEITNDGENNTDYKGDYREERSLSEEWSACDQGDIDDDTWQYMYGKTQKEIADAVYNLIDKGVVTDIKLMHW